MPIILWNNQVSYPNQVLTEIVEQYNQEHQDFPVDLVVIKPQDYAGASMKALEVFDEKEGDRSKLPDVVLAPEFMSPNMETARKQNKVLSASTLLDKEQLADIPEIVSRTFGPHCVPFNPACGVLYINSSMLEEIGVSPEWKPQTLEDLAAMSRKLIEAGKVERGYTCAWPEAYLAEVVLAQTNKSLLTEAGEYNFAQLSNHICNIRKLVAEGVFLPPAAGNYDATRELFINRKVAFYIQGSGHHKLIADESAKANFKVGYSALPTLCMGQKEKYAFPLGGSAIWILNKQTSDEMVQNVRSFLNYMASAKVQKEWHEKTGYVPASLAVANDEEFYSTHPLHKAVVEQTIKAKLGENSFGIKKDGYRDVRIKLYPLLRELITLEGTEEEVRQIIEGRLKTFDAECNQGSLAAKPAERCAFIRSALSCVCRFVSSICCCS